MIVAFEKNGVLYNTINFDLESQTEPSRSDSNYTAVTTRLGILLCPSDPVSSGTKFGSTNYAGNCGTEFITFWKRLSGNGAFPMRDYMPLSGVTDGLSHTAAMSEWLVADELAVKPSDIKRLSLAMPNWIRDPATLAEACSRLDPGSAKLKRQRRGLNWLLRFTIGLRRGRSA
jgi:hypothetical protein